ncbi:GATA zinc finger domain-containing protein 14-like [Ctenocephalides felis]|uniref:GATA zinc finger domain-containing protein 14-like n=1 Tax=Ctenocephalides felis TaxID=7515 RepID=UPI000E6E473D|nr:GATA zinc finger domain-containing protein 14-like [Ctenocephalides felis]
MTTTSINPNYIESIRAPANFIQAKQNYSSEPNFSFLKNHNDKNDIEFQNTNMEDSHNLNEIAQWKMNSNSINNNEKLLESSRQNTSLHGKHEQHYFGSGNMQGIGCNQIYKHCVNNNGETNEKSHSSTNFVDKNIFTQYVSDQNFSTIHPIQSGGNVSGVEPQNYGIRNQMQIDDIHNNKSINKKATLQIGINFDRPKEYSNESLQFAQDNAYQIFDNRATIKNNINTNKMWCDQSRNQNRCQNFNRNTDIKNDDSYEINRSYTQIGNIDDNYKNVNEMDCNFHQTRDDYVSKCLDSNIVSYINTPTVTQNDVEMTTANDNMYSTNLKYASNEHNMSSNQNKYRELFSKLDESYNAIVKTPVLSPYDVKISPMHITKSDMGFKYSDYTNRNNNTRFGYCNIQDERNDIRHRQFLKRQPILYESPTKKKISNFGVRGWPMVNPPLMNMEAEYHTHMQRKSTHRTNYIMAIHSIESMMAVEILLT